MAHNRYKTHCKHGHAFTPENTRLLAHPRGTYRACVTCRRSTARATHRKRYSDPDKKQRMLRASSAWKQRNPKKINEQRRTRYAMDPTYRARTLGRNQRIPQYRRVEQYLRRKDRMPVSYVAHRLFKGARGHTVRELLYALPGHEIIALYRAQLKLKRAIQCKSGRK